MKSKRAPDEVTIASQDLFQKKKDTSFVQDNVNIIEENHQAYKRNIAKIEKYWSNSYLMQEIKDLLVSFPVSC